MKIFTVFDLKSENFATPFFLETTECAKRAFGDIINEDSKSNMISMHPEDFVLYELGSFDQKDAKIDILSLPKPIATGLDYFPSLPSSEV